MALFPIGGVLGGLAYGSRDWPGRLARRPGALAALTAACYGLPALALLPGTAAVALLLAGGCADILLVTTYQLVDARVPEQARTEAGAWLNSTYNLGSAMGTAVSGALVSHAGPHAAITVITVLTAACAALGLMANPGRRLRR
jgi:predicted MFS family arabinose efflux permease